MIHTVYVSIGSNIDRERYIAVAVTYLRERFDGLVFSPVYESEAVGFAGEAFLNLVAKLETTLELSELVADFKALEAAYGRRPDTPKYASKTLDIDILTFDDWVGEFSGVQLPRPEITENAFVLQPLQDIAGDRLHPQLALSYGELWRRYDQSRQRLWRVDVPVLSDEPPCP